jgi:hypothetical protein
MKGTVIIDDVDLKQLEQQRMVLIDIVMEGQPPAVTEQQTQVCTERQEALEGILNMLDSWSDKQLEIEDLTRRLYTALGIPSSFWPDALQKSEEGPRKLSEGWTYEEEPYVPWSHMTLPEKLRHHVDTDYTIDGMICNSTGRIMADAAQEIEDLESWKDEVMKDKCTVLQNLGMHKKIDSICARLYIARHIACDSELVGECLNELDQFYKQGPTQNC